MMEDTVYFWKSYPIKAQMQHKLSNSNTKQPISYFMQLSYHAQSLQSLLKKDIQNTEIITYLSKIALNNAKVAYLIFNCAVSRKLLLNYDAEDNYVKIAAQHEIIALFILQDSTFRKKLLEKERYSLSKKRPFLWLAEQHLSIALLICNEDKNLQELILENNESVNVKISDMVGLFASTTKERLTAFFNNQNKASHRAQKKE